MGLSALGLVALAASVGLASAACTSPRRPLPLGDNCDECCRWSSGGECEKNARYMTANCAFSCVSPACQPKGAALVSRRRRHQPAPRYSYAQGPPPTAYHKPKPKPSYHKPTPKPSYHKPTPKPSYRKPVTYHKPKPSYSKPAPTYHRPTPAPSYHKPTPAPSYHKPKPAPTYQKPKPAPTYQKPKPKPRAYVPYARAKPATYHKATPAPSYHKPTPPPRKSYGYAPNPLAHNPPKAPTVAEQKPQMVFHFHKVEYVTPRPHGPVVPPTATINPPGPAVFGPAPPAPLPVGFPHKSASARRASIVASRKRSMARMVRTIRT